MKSTGLIRSGSAGYHYCGVRSELKWSVDFVTQLLVLLTMDVEIFTTVSFKHLTANKASKEDRRG